MDEKQMLDVSGVRHVERDQEHMCVETPSQEPRQVVLVFQGGGVLGAYQAGVYQALHEAGVEPDWIIGTSIGAINAAIIAGNQPADRLDRLNEFWSRMEQRKPWSLFPAWTGIPEQLTNMSTIMNGIEGFFRPNP